MQRSKEDYIRINIVFPKSLLAQVDEKAKSLNISRSAFVMTALSQKIQADEMMNNFPLMLASLDSLKSVLEESKQYQFDVHEK